MASLAAAGPKKQTSHPRGSAQLFIVCVQRPPPKQTNRLQVRRRRRKIAGQPSCEKRTAKKPLDWSLYLIIAHFIAHTHTHTELLSSLRDETRRDEREEKRSENRIDKHIVRRFTCRLRAPYLRLPVGWRAGGDSRQTDSDQSAVRSAAKNRDSLTSSSSRQTSIV